MKTLFAIARLGASLKSIAKSLDRIAQLYALELDMRFNVRLIDPSKLSAKERDVEVMYGPSRPDKRRESDLDEEWEDNEGDSIA